ncbi:MAG: CehA/McbA family metallohydrolase [Ardenticatenaceae bacterium]
MSTTLSLSTVINPQPGWYGGDFHVHTNYSDGVLTPPQLADLARAEGMDFLAITDHNTINAYPHFGQPSDLLIIPGIEVTLEEGHFNVFGLQNEADWVEQIQSTSVNWTGKLGGHYKTMNNIMQEAASAGLLNSINHPVLPPWAWLDDDTDLRHVHCIEIWNDPSWPDNQHANPEAVQLWTALLNAGYRITAIGGSDFHRPQPRPGRNKPAERLGFPRTYVYANHLSGEAILAGLRQQRAYVSMGVKVDFQIEINNTVYGIGDEIGPVSGKLYLKGTVLDTPPEGWYQVMKNGTVIRDDGMSARYPMLDGYDEVEATESAWYRFNVFNMEGQMLAVTNPIFIGPKPVPTLHKYGDFSNR